MSAEKHKVRPHFCKNAANYSCTENSPKKLSVEWWLLNMVMERRICDVAEVAWPDISLPANINTH